MVPSLSGDLLGYLAWPAAVRAPLLAVEFTKVISDDALEDYFRRRPYAVIPREGGDPVHDAPREAQGRWLLRHPLPAFAGTSFADDDDREAGLSVVRFRVAIFARI
jgi:hypothetical protein